MAKAKSEFMLAITQLAAEKNLPRDVVLDAVESALASAFRKNSFSPNQNVSAKLDPETGQVSVFAGMMVVEKVTNPTREISLEDARRINKYAQLEEELMVEATPQNAGRIAAQTAKQVVLQRLREAEREMVFEEFSDRENEIVTGIIQRIEPKQITMDLGRTEGVLPSAEQVRTEHYRTGQRVKVYILGVHRTVKGPQIVVSRTHRNLLRRLLELEVPEVHQGAIELKAIAREAGQRSKIAVSARQEGIDPIGSCVGLRGIRIQNIVNELNGEKIDVVQWDADTAAFIANALSPAQVESVTIDNDQNVAVVVVPDRQLSLAIGREGQNARLAAKLTGWRIDIKSASIAEAEKEALEKEDPASVKKTSKRAKTAKKEPEIIEAVKAVEEIEPAEAVIESAVEDATVLAEIAEPEADLEEEISEDTAVLEEDLEILPEEEFAYDYEEEEDDLPAAKTGMPVIRFAEDIMPGRGGPRSEKKGQKGKKGKKSKGKVKEEVVKSAPKPKERRAADIRIDKDEIELALPAELKDVPDAKDAEEDFVLDDDLIAEAASSKTAKKVKKKNKANPQKEKPKADSLD